MAALASAVDVYGFQLGALTPAQEKDRAKAAKAAAKQEKAWAKYTAKGKLPFRAGKRKDLVRSGVPASFRAFAWMEGSPARQMRASKPPGYFRSLLQDPEASRSLRQIELDLPRTFATHPWLRSEEGQAALRRVLTAFSVHNPGVGYCQGLNFLAALLLTATGKDEETAFWLLAALVERILYPGTYAANLHGCHVEMRVLASLVADKLPRVSKHLDALGCEMSILATDWFLCLFCNNLPAEGACRVLDALFFEGSKILHRVSLAVLKLVEKRLLSFDNAGELMMAVKQHVGSMHDVGPLMDTAFNNIGSMPHAALDARRRRQEDEVKAYFAARVSRQNGAAVARQAG